MEATNSSETSVVMPRCTWRHIADYLNLKPWEGHIFMTKVHTHDCELFWWPYVKHVTIIVVPNLLNCFVDCITQTYFTNMAAGPIMQPSRLKLAICSKIFTSYFADQTSANRRDSARLIRSHANWRHRGYWRLVQHCHLCGDHPNSSSISLLHLR